MKRHSVYGWLELILGILLIVLGIWALAKPDFVLTSIVYAYAIAAIIMGIADLILYIEMERYIIGFGSVISLISGILSVMCGAMLLVHPRTGVLILTILFPIWFIAHCISRLTHLNYIRLIAGNGIYTFMMVINIIGLFLGFLMLFNPFFTLSTIRYIASAYLILLGIDGILMACSTIGRSC